MKGLDIEMKKSIYNRQIPELAIHVLLSSESNEFQAAKSATSNLETSKEKPRWLVTCISIVLQSN